MKTAVLGGVSDLPGIVSVSVYDTKPVHFLSMCYNTIKWVEKTRQVRDTETEMVRDANFFYLNVDGSYNHNMNSVDLIDQLRNL